MNRVVPRENQYEIEISDATPAIIRKHSLNDEQALLAIVQYNRLIDIFLGVTAYSLQNQVRTNIPKLGQIETGEIYVGFRNTPDKFVISARVMGGTDQLQAVQLQHDRAFCGHYFPNLNCRLIAVQFKRAHNRIVMYEVTVQNDEIKVVEERHFRLISASEITDDDLIPMRHLK